VEHSVGSVPFDVEKPPVVLEVGGRRDPNWIVEANSAGPVPLSPLSSTEPLKTLTLVPYGAAKLRITAFPYLKEKWPCGSPTGVAELYK
jgi:hypothetical protein